MFTPSLDLTVVLWVAKHNNGEIIHKGPQINGVIKYELIRRDDLDTFALIYRNDTILELHPKERTLAVRMKSVGSFNMGESGEISNNRINARVWVVALLSRPKENPKKAFIPNNHGNQEYTYDSEESTIYYLFENGKIETRTHFGSTSPYTPIELTELELEHFASDTKKK